MGYCVVGLECRRSERVACELSVDHNQLFLNQMIQASTLAFLRKLKSNNNKPWFDANRALYDAAKADFIQFTALLLEGISKFDKEIAMAGLDAKKCISRINRDIRFSKNKDPYKSNFFALINKGGKKSVSAGYYFQLEPGNNSFVGGGVYMPMPPELHAFRQEIDYNFNEWQSIVEGKTFKKHFPGGVQAPEILSRPPKGYDLSNPAIEYLKMKGFYTFNPCSDKDLQSPTCIKKILDDYKTTLPMIEFLNRAI